MPMIAPIEISPFGVRQRALSILASLLPRRPAGAWRGGSDGMAAADAGSGTLDIDRNPASPERWTDGSRRWACSRG
jgi:hypothetical protein